MEKAALTGLEPPDLEPLESDQMPRRDLAHRTDGTPTAKPQRNHRYAEECAYTDPDRPIIKGNGEIIQIYNCQAVVDGDHPVIVALGVEQPATGCGASRPHAGAHDREHRRLSDNLHR